MYPAPCKNCESRHFKCHSECAPYTEWRKLLEASKQQISKQAIINYQLQERKFEAVYRMQPQRRRKNKS